MRKVEYFEIADAKVSEKKNIIISECSKGGFTIAQRMDVKEGDHTNRVYLKGAFHINDIHGLYELRDAINYGIHVVEEREKDDTGWDF